MIFMLQVLCLRVGQTRLSNYVVARQSVPVDLSPQIRAVFPTSTVLNDRAWIYGLNARSANCPYQVLQGDRVQLRDKNHVAVLCLRLYLFQCNISCPCLLFLNHIPTLSTEVCHQ
jgi:hypothetical protein